MSQPAPNISTQVWEVRPTVGSDTNGGGFDSTAGGTDYSKQNAKNSSGSNKSTTDLTTTTTGGFTSTSTTAAFTSAITGNFIYLSGGTGGTVTAGWYYATYATATTITLDRSPGAAATNVTMNVGGALATISQAYTNSYPSATVWVQTSGTYTATTALALNIDSHAAPGAPFSIIGYTTVRGDNGQFTWTTATNSTVLITMNACNNVSLQNISFTTTAGTKTFCIEAVTAISLNITLNNCKINGFTTGINGDYLNVYLFSGLFIINSRITACTIKGVINSGNTYIYGSMIDGNTSDGFATGTDIPIHGTSWIFKNSIFYNNGGNGITINGGDTTESGMVALDHCICSTNTGAGLLIINNSTNPALLISNSIFDKNSTYGIDGSSGTTTIYGLLYNNAFYSNTTAATRNINAGISTITLTASPYVSIGTNFALNATSGGGPLLNGLGWPGVLQAGGTGYASVGALEVQAGVATVPLTVSIQDPLWYGV